MVISINYKELEAILNNQPWVRELAGILPLSALLDFLDMEGIIHLFQLCGAIPMWSWSVGPSGSRLLFAGERKDGSCFLDSFENNKTPLCIDGRYGDKYFTPNPETIRLIVGVAQSEKIDNAHGNITRNDNRLQNLEIIHVKRQTLKRNGRLLRYKISSMIGWIVLFGLIVAGVVLERWLLVAYLITVPLTGVAVSAMYGGQPRKLAVHLGSQYSRLVIVAKHTNERNWQVFLGESTVVNALLNKPLETGSQDTQYSTILGITLQALICAQWAIAIGSAATKGWDAYAISFWILFSIISHKLLFPGNFIARLWLAEGAEIDVRRYHTKLSSRRAFLNTILALNPDTFLKPDNGHLLDQLDEQALKWIDPVLEKSRDRDIWQEASRLALLQQVKLMDASSGKRSKVTAAFQELETSYGHHYWYKYIEEGIDMAVKIGQTIRVPTAIDSYKKLDKC
ncbi:hypothetical protein G7054_g2539 [Neopestalotiopsis clavispora]|nr:hypothetical protein G7054_g2539 [Neopestalotiopsis clavispora]